MRLKALTTPTAAFSLIVALTALRPREAVAQTLPSRRSTGNTLNAIELVERGNLARFYEQRNLQAVETDAGDRVAVVIVHRDVSNDAVRYTLGIINAYQASPQMEELLTWNTHKQSSAVTLPTWFDGGRRIAFVGHRDGKAAEVYAVDIASHRVAQLSHTTSLSFPTDAQRNDIDIGGLAVSDNGRSVAYVAVVHKRRTSTRHLDVLARPNNVWAAPFDSTSDVTTSAFLCVVEPGRLDRVVDLPRSKLDGDGPEITEMAYANVFGSKLKFSADGSSLLIKSYFYETQQPGRGVGIQFALRALSLKPGRPALAIMVAQDYVLSTPFVFLDSSHLVINRGSTRRRDQNTPPTNVGKGRVGSSVLNLVTGLEEPLLSDPYLMAQAWDAVNRRLILTDAVSRRPEAPSGEFHLMVILERQSSGWKEVTRRDVPGPLVYVTPRAVYFQKGESGSGEENDGLAMQEIDSQRQGMLIDFKRELQGPEGADRTTLRWTASNELPAEAVLTRPVGSDGRRVPVVILTEPNGYTQIIQQLLALHGIASLPTEGWNSFLKVQTTPAARQQEPNRDNDAIESAIDELDRRGWIEPERVGLFGFSNGGRRTSSLLVYGRRKYDAAVIEDSAFTGPLSTIFNRALAAADSPLLNGLGWGTGPFWSNGIADAVKSGTEFNTYKVRAPVLFQCNQLESYPMMYFPFALLLMQGKATEFVYTGNETHVAWSPATIAAAVERDVDWYRFWLKDEEDSDPKKAEQYARWRSLRESHRAALKRMDEEAAHRGQLK